jgi:hypothetical protein
MDYSRWRKGGIAMRRSIALILAALVLTVGCASTFSFRREEVYDETVRAYGRLISWSDFGSAAAFLAPDAAVKTVPPGVRVARYDFKQAIFTQDKTEAINLIEITYYRETELRVKTLMDRQLWQYNAERDTWLLKSGFPAF